MAITAATLGEEARITDYISLGVITSAFPEKAIRTAMAETGRRSVWERELPAQIVIITSSPKPCLCRFRNGRFCAACWKKCDDCLVRRFRSR
jgi:hypothetical protein